MRTEVSVMDWLRGAGAATAGDDAMTQATPNTVASIKLRGPRVIRGLGVSPERFRGAAAPRALGRDAQATRTIAARMSPRDRIVIASPPSPVPPGRAA